MKLASILFTPKCSSEATPALPSHLTTWFSREIHLILTTKSWWRTERWTIVWQCTCGAKVAIWGPYSIFPSRTVCMWVSLSPHLYILKSQKPFLAYICFKKTVSSTFIQLFIGIFWAACGAAEVELLCTSHLYGFKENMIFPLLLDCFKAIYWLARPTGNLQLQILSKTDIGSFAWIVELNCKMKAFFFCHLHPESVTIQQLFFSNVIFYAAYFLMHHFWCGNILYLISWREREICWLPDFLRTHNPNTKYNFKSYNYILNICVSF